MPVRTLATAATCFYFALALAGCQENPFRQNAVVLKDQVGQLQQEQTLVAQRSKELQDRATELDRNNQELEALLAQSRQREQVVSDRVETLNEQLREVSTRLAQVQTSKQDAEKRVDALTASIRERGGAVIKANNSLADSLPRFSVSGINARVDGDVIRIEMSADDLFEVGSVRLKPTATRILDHVAAELESSYPRQMVGIEGHIARDSTSASQGGHKQSAGQAEAVFDYFVQRGRINPGRLFFTGHGANQPVYANTSAEGRRRNHRVEVVVYPEEVAN